MTNYKPMNGHGYRKMTQIDTDRMQVNYETKHTPKPCIPVSLEFFEQMRDCLPPQFYGNTDQHGYYSMMQVGEVADHNTQGLPVYETYTRMNPSTPADLQDVRMVADQWYFTGLHTDQATRRNN